MPFRDAGRWIARAVRSIQGQTDADWELVAVDDGSRDQSRGAVEALAASDPRIRILETSPGGRGIVAALNLGLGDVRGRLLARMDADDLSLPTRLAKQRAALEQASSLFGVACQVAALPAKSGSGMRRYLAWQNGLCTREELARERFVESPLIHPSVMMRTATLRERLGGWRECGWPEDWDLFLRAFDAGLRFERVPEVLLRWRLHPGQLTRNDPRYSAERILTARAHYLSRYLCGAVRSRPCWILGAGPTGKRLVKALAREQSEIAGLVDVDPKKIGGIIRDGARRWPVISSEAFLALRSRPFAVAAVGSPQGRERVRAFLMAAGWREDQDFVVAA